MMVARQREERRMGDFPSLGRDSQFAYTCNRCMTCCHDAHIALDPYEIARLARNRQLTTTEFIARSLTEGGIVLRNREDTSCVMLGTDGCTVYADRPQICRTYPLKRLRGKDGEVFWQYPGLPASTGVFGKNGAVSEFLRAHEVDELFAAKDRYFDLAFRIATVLAEAVKREPHRFAKIREVIDTRCEFQGLNPRQSPTCREPGTVPALIDVDRVVSDYCHERHIEFPDTLDEKIALHMRAIEDRLARISAQSGNDPDRSGDLLEMAEFAGALGAATEVRVMLAFIDGVFGGRESRAT
jgi:Fe-S-cluster containining protein